MLILGLDLILYIIPIFIFEDSVYELRSLLHIRSAVWETTVPKRMACSNGVAPNHRPRSPGPLKSGAMGANCACIWGPDWAFRHPDIVPGMGHVGIVPAIV